MFPTLHRPKEGSATELFKGKRLWSLSGRTLSLVPTYQLHVSTHKMKPYYLCHVLDNVCTPLYEYSQQDVLCPMFNNWKLVGEMAFQNNLIVLHVSTICSTSMILDYRVTTY